MRTLTPSPVSATATAQPSAAVSISCQARSRSSSLSCYSDWGIPADLLVSSGSAGVDQTTKDLDWKINPRGCDLRGRSRLSNSQRWLSSSRLRVLHAHACRSRLQSSTDGEVDLHLCVRPPRRSHAAARPHKSPQQVGAGTLRGLSQVGSRQQ